ncbi:Hypothetical predicted protein [Paramuricea clavata]|uniref:Uncharacterized protein n=1 Tax=Paramuricea clavata TaxID=317549 RepID=A0A6S7FY98_PARCT|nr:Hypothetical predicted protein [Paramuricea clavata]
MSSDDEHFNFDSNANPNGTQGDRHSPPTSDEGHHPGDGQANRPPTLFLPRQGSVEHSRFEEILKRTKNYETISKVPYHIQEEVQDSLNVTNKSQDDWRGVAARMGVKAITIEKIARDFKENPTHKLFQELSSKKTTEFLQVLYQMDLQDVLNIFYDNMCITKPAKHLKPTVNFHSTYSTNFWHKIPPPTRKEWKQVEEVLKRDFRKQSMQSQVMRFICYVLKIEPYEERHNKYVHEQDFANLVAWFGPVKDGKDGLFEKIAQLIKDSIMYKGNSGPHSFFAGYMTKDEADRLIGNEEKVGTFLIRFSLTYAQSGCFIVCLKTNTGVEHVLLEGNPATGKISYDGKDYDDLVTLYRRALCKGGVSQDRRTSCTTICPNLPLNAMFKPCDAGP